MEELITKYLNHTLSDSEAKQLQSWLQRDPLNREIFENIKGDWSIKMQDIKTSKEALLQKIKSNKLEPVESVYVSPDMEVHKGAKTHAASKNLWYAVAASVALLLAVGTYFFSPNPVMPPTTYTTGYGEVREITLADGSSVMLNANSKLKLNGHAENDKREVWLTGEAFFDVIHTQDDKPFVVYANGTSVNVLGTEFNVYARRENVRVVLETGKVMVKPETLNKGVYMEPGEKVTFNKKSNTIEKTKDINNHHTYWRNNELVLDEAGLQEVANILEDNYGLELTYPEELSSKRFVGIFPADNVEVLIETLGKYLKIERSGRSISLEPLNE